MMIKRVITIFLSLFVNFLCTDNSLDVSTKVSLTDGLIQGYQDNDLKVFLGIPYAEPPIGPLRWAPSKKKLPWEGVLDVKKNENICFQPKMPTEFYDRDPDVKNMSEDCLTLNVWTRANDINQKLPVMVWIHGGALVWGSGCEYKGDEITKKGVILVTVNYRLGPLGFYAHPELSAENGTSGNQGFRDQIAALEWVKENIAKFGGNPDNITIFGESAGSWSVNVLQASPLSRGLFHKVIGQSGARLIPLTHINQKAPYSDSAENLGVILSKVMSDSREPSLQELRKLSPKQIIQNIEKDPLYSTQFDSLTIIDGEVIPEDISIIFKKGNQADVPVLIGSTADEAITFDPKMLNPGLSMMSYMDLTNSSIYDILPEIDEEIFQYYPVENEEQAKESWIGFTTDAMFTAQMQKWGYLMSTVDSPAFLYLWNWHPTVNGSKALKAFHAAEVPYVFGTMDFFDIEDSKEDREFSNLMIEIWTNFAKTGNPSVEDKIEWPVFKADSQEYISLSYKVEKKEYFRSKKVQLINEAYDRSRVIFKD